MKSLPGNQIVLWSYANILPLAMMISIAAWYIFFSSNSSVNGTNSLQKTLYSITAFLVWTRVVHLLKIFTQTSYILRVATETIYRIRWLFSLIAISLITFYYVYRDTEESNSGTDTYQTILLIIIACFNIFFIFTIMVQISIGSITNADGT